ncbi:unnamed protein product [Moneuplotes crassus]|uniref:Uncharacterized protein n=1 Tax=Euplotes crassus TaxID=5936 RepID=A0AAD1U4X7_EUPCR|nr:unnamed protein product [Moneuplotes crassus]
MDPEVCPKQMVTSPDSLQAQNCYGEYQKPIEWAFQRFNSTKFQKQFVHCSVQDLSKLIIKKTQTKPLLTNQKVETLETIELIQGVQECNLAQSSVQDNSLEINKTASKLVNMLQRTLMPPPNPKVSPLNCKRNIGDQSEIQKELTKPENSVEKDTQLKLKLQIEEDKQAQPDDDFGVEEADEKAQFDFPLSPKNKRRMIRWGKCQDKKLFAAIRSLEKQGVLQLESLLAMNTETEADNNQGVAALAEKIQWKCKFKNLVYRVKKLSNKKFSFREVKALKRIIKKEYQDKPIDYDKVLYHFPGKSMGKMVITCSHIKDCIKNRSLSHFESEY